MVDEIPSYDFIENSFGDRYLFEVNGIAFDKIGSAALYHKQFGEQLSVENHFYIILGQWRRRSFFMGQCLEWIVEEPEKFSSAVARW